MAEMLCTSQLELKLTSFEESNILASRMSYNLAESLLNPISTFELGIVRLIFLLTGVLIGEAEIRFCFGRATFSVINVCNFSPSFVVFPSNQAGRMFLTLGVPFGRRCRTVIAHRFGNASEKVNCRYRSPSPLYTC